MKKQIRVMGLMWIGAILPAQAEQPTVGMAKPEKIASAVHHGAGKVVAVDREKSSIKLAHEAIKSLGWPGMTMSFGVEKASLLDGLREGDAVTFELRQLQSKKWEIVKIRRN